MKKKTFLVRDEVRHIYVHDYSFPVIDDENGNYLYAQFQTKSTTDGVKEGELSVKVYMRARPEGEWYFKREFIVERAGWDEESYLKGYVNSLGYSIREV